MNVVALNICTGLGVVVYTGNVFIIMVCSVVDRYLASSPHGLSIRTTQCHAPRSFQTVFTSRKFLAVSNAAKLTAF